MLWLRGSLCNTKLLMKRYLGGWLAILPFQKLLIIFDYSQYALLRVATIFNIKNQINYEIFFHPQFQLMNDEKYLLYVAIKLTMRHFCNELKTNKSRFVIKSNRWLPHLNLFTIYNEINEGLVAFCGALKNLLSILLGN